MSYGYIVFCYANSNFLVPLEQFHIILNPDEILEKIGTNENEIKNIYFGNKLINIIHLSKYLYQKDRFLFYILLLIHHHYFFFPKQI